MARATTPGFACRECGWTSVKWQGRCGECQVWDSLVEQGAPTSKVTAVAVSATRAS